MEHESNKEHRGRGYLNTQSGWLVAKKAYLFATTRPGLWRHIHQFLAGLATDGVFPLKGPSTGYILQVVRTWYQGTGKTRRKMRHLSFWLAITNIKVWCWLYKEVNDVIWGLGTPPENMKWTEWRLKWIRDFLTTRTSGFIREFM